MTSLRRFTATRTRQIESPRLVAAWSPDWAKIRAKRRAHRQNKGAA